MRENLNVVDTKILAQVKAILRDQWPEIVTLYLNDAAAYIEKIQLSCAHNDKKAMIIAAHTLKAASRNIGMISLGDLAEKIEIDATEAEQNNVTIGHIQNLVPLLQEALAQANVKLQETV